MKAPKNLWLFDDSKLQILSALYNCDDHMCGCDLVACLKMSKHLLSYHLKLLREKKLITEIKCGRRKQYRLNQKKIQQVELALRATAMI